MLFFFQILYFPCYLKHMKRKSWLLLTAFFLGAAYFCIRIFLMDGSFAFDSSKVFRYLILAPAAEELFFRGVLQEWLERRMAQTFFVITAANISVSAVFAVFHLWGGNPVHAFAVFFPSLVFGTLYSQYRTVMPCVLCHAFYNLNVMIV